MDSPCVGCQETKLLCHFPYHKILCKDWMNYCGWDIELEREDGYWTIRICGVLDDVIYVGCGKYQDLWYGLEKVAKDIQEAIRGHQSARI